MMIWDRICCRWVAWHGTARAWRALPHAVMTLACVVCSGPMRALPAHTNGAIVGPSTAHPSLAGPSWPPTSAFLGQPGWPTDGVPTGSIYLLGTTVEPSSQPTQQPSLPNTRSVPEPSTLALLLVGTLLLGLQSSQSAKNKLRPSYKADHNNSA